MILNSLICIIAFLGISGFGYLANFLLSTKYKALSSIFILGFIFQTIILQIHYIFFPINFQTSFIYLILSIILFFYFKNFSIKDTILGNKFLSSIFFIIFVFLQSTSIQYPTNLDIPDFYLYHKNYIDWINNYPAVEGLALLNPRHGYAGVSYLNAAYYNFHPFFNNGWAVLTPTFIIFFLTIFFEVLVKNKNFHFKDINLSSIFILTSFYLIFKFILIISKADTSHFLIFTIIAIYLFYLLLKNIENFNRYEILLILIISVFLPSIIFSLTIYSFLIFLVVIYICYIHSNLNFIFYFKYLFIVSLLVILPFLYLNYIKSGYFFYPVTYFDNWISLDKSWSVATTLGPTLIEGASIYNWEKEKDLSIALITNWPPLILALLFMPVTIFLFLKNNRLKPFFILFILCISLVIIWYFSAPEQRYGTPYVWTLLFFEISIILYLFNFKFFKISKRFAIIIFIAVLNLTQLIRYYDSIDFNFDYKYLPGDFTQHYKKINRDGFEYIIYDDKYLLIYNGDNLLVTEYLSDFKLLKRRNIFYFKHTRKK